MLEGVPVQKKGLQLCSAQTSRHWIRLQASTTGAYKSRKEKGREERGESAKVEAAECAVQSRAQARQRLAAIKIG